MAERRTTGRHRLEAPPATAASPVTGPIRRTRDFKLFNPLGDHRETLGMIIGEAPRVQKGNGSEQMLRGAFDFALRVHEGQKRKDGERDYIVHLLGALYYTVVVLRGNAHTGCIALLHDTLEDGPQRGVAVNYSSVRDQFGEAIADDVALMTIPKCVGPRESQHEWVYAEDPRYVLTRDHYRAGGGKPPMAAYLEMRDRLFERLLTAKGIRAFVIKLGEAVDNLVDIHFLSDASRERKLAEDITLMAAAARIDWTLRELMRTLLERHEIKVPDLNAEIAAQMEQGVVICRPRSQLDYKMATAELPIQHPDSTVITVYADKEGLHETGELEIGLPRVFGNGNNLARLRELFRGLGLRISVGRSLFYGAFDLDARESIYYVERVAAKTPDKTQKRFDDIVDRLRILQAELSSATRTTDTSGLLELGGAGGASPEAVGAVKK